VVLSLVAGQDAYSTYCCDRLHAEHERVGGQVSRVGERVFLPELAEEVLLAWHVRVVVGKVS